MTFPQTLGSSFASEAAMLELDSRIPLSKRGNKNRLIAKSLLVIVPFGARQQIVLDTSPFSENK